MDIILDKTFTHPLAKHYVTVRDFAAEEWFALRLHVIHTPPLVPPNKDGLLCACRQYTHPRHAACRRGCSAQERRRHAAWAKAAPAAAKRGVHPRTVAWRFPGVIIPGGDARPNPTAGPRRAS